jgi:hypothetical protein
MTSTDFVASFRARALLDQAAAAPNGYLDDRLPRGEQVALATAYALLAISEELAATRAVLAEAAGDIDAGLTALHEMASAMHDQLGDIAEHTDSTAADLAAVADEVEAIAIACRPWWRKLRRAVLDALPCWVYMGPLLKRHARTTASEVQS